MKSVLSIALWLLVATVARADVFDDAVAANKRGDYFTSFPIFESLAAKGDPAAQTSLGVMLEKGQGVPQTPAEAVRWYRLAAQQGYGTAQVNLGLMYGKGVGVQKDEVRAYMWFVLAAGTGAANAIRNRNVASQTLTPDQAGQALQMARDCLAREFRDCE